MKHLLSIQALSKPEVESLIAKAIQFKASKSYKAFQDYTVANLFYENSTRTRVSFELAAKHLQMKVINLDLNTSSESKGETIEDTLQTLAAMGIDTFVMRHQEEGIQARLAKLLPKHVHLINAGDGKGEHPSQALLDMMTILEKKPNLASLKVAILGDIAHSRVANSFQRLAKTLNLNDLTLVAPKRWQPSQIYHGKVTDSIEEGLQDADIVYCLRVQRERLKTNETLNEAEYRAQFALTEKTLKYAKKDAYILHPGPINRGIEIDSNLADSPKSLILQQVQNGVFMRMAIFDKLLVS